MNKKNAEGKLFKTFISGLVCLVLLIMLTPATYAGSELRVAWETGDVMDSLSIGTTWQYENMGCILWQLLYDQMWMLGPGPDYETLPRAAVKFETDDNITWRITLREGMTFHDGKPVTAEDVAFTLEYLPISNPIWHLYDCSTQKDSVVAIDNRSVEFKMENKLGNKYPPFNYYPILPKHIWKRHKFDMENFDNDKGIGSGPFKLNSFKAGQYFVFDRFEDYWEKTPRVDKIIFRGFGGADAKIMAMKRGEIDMTGYQGVSPLATRFLKNEPDIEVIESRGSNFNVLSFNLHPDGPIKNLTVRKAIAHGMDLNKITEMVYHGYSELQDSFIYPEMPEYNPNLPEYEFNPALANKLLDSTEYKDTDGDGLRNDPKNGDNIRIRFLASNELTEYPKIATLFREQMKALGLDVIINIVDVDTFYDILFYPQGNGFNIGLSWAEPGPKADWIWEYMRSVNGGPAGWNTSYYDNPKVDILLDALYAETDMEKRKELSFKLQEIMMEDLPYYVICRPKTLHPVRIDKLEGYETRCMGGIANWFNPFTYFYVHAK